MRIEKNRKTYCDKWGRNALDRIQISNISQRNKDLLKDFQNYLFSTGSGTNRVAKVTNQLKIMLLFEEDGKRVMPIDLDKASKRDIMNLVAYVNQIDSLAEATKSDYRRSIKQFYLWFEEEDEKLLSDNTLIRIKATQFYKYIKTNVKRAYKQKQIDPSTILTEEDIEVVTKNGCRSIKEKAFLKFLHETGLRAGEMLNLRVGHIVLKKNIGVAHVDGKTGKRTVHFTKSMPYLVQWLNLHPFRENPESDLWLGESTNKMHQPLVYRGAIALVKRCFKRANVKKKYNLHWFRHSRASLLAPHLPESLLCKFMGWRLGSKQVRTYLHLCPQQLEDAFLKINGLSKVEEDNKSLPQKCNCGTINDSFSRYCHVCGNPLSVEVAVQDQDIVKKETEKSIKLLMEIAQNPELMKRFEEFKTKLKNI